MALKIIWSPRAASNLEEICDYISRDSEYYAALFAKRMVKIIKDIPLFPHSGRIVPEYENENIREKIHGNYRIVYRIKEDAIEIVTIFHDSQLLR